MKALRRTDSAPTPQSPQIDAYLSESHRRTRSGPMTTEEIEIPEAMALFLIEYWIQELIDSDTQVPNTEEHVSTPEEHQSHVDTIPAEPDQYGIRHEHHTRLPHLGTAALAALFYRDRHYQKLKALRRTDSAPTPLPSQIDAYLPESLRCTRSEPMITEEIEIPEALALLSTEYWIQKLIDSDTQFSNTEEYVSTSEEHQSHVDTVPAEPDQYRTRQEYHIRLPHLGTAALAPMFYRDRHHQKMKALRRADSAPTPLPHQIDAYLPESLRCTRSEPMTTEEIEIPEALALLSTEYWIQKLIDSDTQFSNIEEYVSTSEEHQSHVDTVPAEPDQYRTRQEYHIRLPHLGTAALAPMFYRDRHHQKMKALRRTDSAPTPLPHQIDAYLPESLRCTRSEPMTAEDIEIPEALALLSIEYWIQKLIDSDTQVDRHISQGPIVSEIVPAEPDQSVIRQEPQVDPDYIPSNPSRQSTSASIHRVGQKKDIIDANQVLTLLAALGGGTIGYALNVTGGIFNVPTLASRFPHIYRKKNNARSTNFCSFSDFWFILITSLIPLCASGALWVALKLSNHVGRKTALMTGLMLMLCGLGGLLWLPNTSIAIVGMILVGLGVGLIFQVIPTIYSELAPKKAHRKLGILFGYQVSGGLMSFSINLIISFYPQLWRLLFGVPFVVIIFLLILTSFLVNETPRFLIEQDKLDAAEYILRKYRSTKDVELEFKELVISTKEDKGKDPVKELLSYQNRPTLIINTMAQVLPQLLGVVPLMFFGPLASTSISSFSLISVITQVVGGGLGLVCTLIATCFLQKIKRRKLGIISSFAILSSQLVMLAVFLLNESPYRNLRKSTAYVMIVSLAMNYVGFTILTNPHGWINSSIPGTGGAIASVWMNSLNLLMAAIMNEVSVNLLCALQAWTFLCTSVVAVIIVCFFFLFVPETTGIGEYTIFRRVWMRHWFWKRYTQRGS